jgi:hypothetical protein
LLKATACVKKLIATFIVLLIFRPASSQHSLGYFAGTGVVYYNGDLNERSSKIISPDKVFKPFLKLGLNYSLGKRMETSLGFFYGNIGGADALAKEKDNRVRNLSFKSVIYEGSLQLEYHLFSFYKEWFLNPYVFAGAGIFHFNPTAILNGVKYDLQSIGTEGQYIGNDNYPKPYKLMQASIPVGIGLCFRLNPKWRLKLQYANHFTFTDYLDDVSTTYPDYALLANTPNGPVAVLLSNRRLNGVYPKTKIERGNSALNDSFSEIGVAIIYNPAGLTNGKSLSSGHFKRKSKNKFDKNTLCPAYK